nr:glutaredoxin [Encephalitozoon cuniculi]
MTEADYGEMVRREKCIMFVKRFCPYSIRARELLHDRGVGCKIIEVDNNLDAYSFAKRNHSTFPVFFLDGDLVEGGCEKLLVLSDSNLPPFDKSPLLTQNREPVLLD